jgi:hypothetical protein
MPVVDVGQKMPSVYLDKFSPSENVVYRLSVLDTRAIATEFHWIDVPSKDIKGSYACIQGVCCTACGRRRQSYNVPVYVYRNPQASTEGEIQIWPMSAPQWKKFSDLALQVDLKSYDLMLTAQKRGWGMDQSYSVVPDVLLRQYWTPEQKEQIPQAVASFYQLGESALVDPMTLNDWNNLLYGLGFDFQNNCWPGGQSPFNQGRATRAIGAAVSALGSPPMAFQGAGAGFLPPAPSFSVQSVPSVGSPVSGSVPQFTKPQGQVGGTIFQPPPPPVAPVPPVQQSVPAFTSSAPVVPQAPQAGQVPQPAVVSSVSAPGPFTGTTLATPPVPQQGVPQPAVATVQAGVPLGTAPVIPQTAMSVPQTQQSSPAIVPGNTISGQVEITPAEMDELLK